MQQTHFDAASTPQLTTSSNSSSSINPSVYDRAAVLLVVLLGLPGAGKSTLAAALCRAAAQQGGRLMCSGEGSVEHTSYIKQLCIGGGERQKGQCGCELLGSVCVGRVGSRSKEEQWWQRRVVLLGLPGAGKSILAAALCRAAAQKGGEPRGGEGAEF
jgi:ABC-type cobalamin/Fe3+-siderophores transport system ATPase subunit